MKKSVSMLIVAVFFAWGAPANAGEAPLEKLRAACGGEIEKLCSTVMLGEGRLLACLEENKDKISEGCNDARLTAKKQFEDLKTSGWDTPVNAEEGPFEKLGAVCGGEIEKLCPEVAIGKGRILECLEENKDKISEPCNQARMNAQKQFKEQEPAD
jgi:hypothetical protein